VRFEIGAVLQQARHSVALTARYGNMQGCVIANLRGVNQSRLGFRNVFYGGDVAGIRSSMQRRPLVLRHLACVGFAASNKQRRGGDCQEKLHFVD
jgi:hypothetical protein